MGSGSQQLIIQGDITNIPALFVKNPGWHAVFDTDGALAEANRRKMLDRAIADKATITGYHYGMPGAGTIAKDGNGYVFTADQRLTHSRRDHDRIPPQNLRTKGATHSRGAFSLPARSQGADPAHKLRAAKFVSRQRKYDRICSAEVLFLRGARTMVHASQQFTPPQLLEAGHRAEAEGRLDLAAQFYRHLTEHYAFTGEAAEARNGLGRVGAAQSQVWHMNGAAHPNGAARPQRRRPVAPRDHYRTGRALARLLSALGWSRSSADLRLLPSTWGSIISHTPRPCRVWRQCKSWLERRVYSAPDCSLCSPARRRARSSIRRMRRAIW